jgi:PAS domain S-box-containing protein
MLTGNLIDTPVDKSARLLKALVEIGQELASTTDLEDLLNRILRIAREVFRFENAIVRLLDENGEHLVAVASYGYDETAVGQVVRVGQGVMGRAAKLEEPVLVADIRKSPDYLPGIPGARSELAVPLISREKLIGVLNVESPRPEAFSRDDVEPLLTLGRQAAIAIENARLYESLRSVSENYRQLHHYNDRILKSINLGVYTVDPELRIISWNQRMAEISGVAAEQAIGSILSELFPNLIKEGVVGRIRKVLDGGNIRKLRVTHRSLEGTIRFQKRRLAPLRDGDQVTGVVVIVEDITEFKRLLDQSIQSEKLVEVGRLSAGIAHEINNPLSLISYAVQLLSRDGGLNVSQEEMVEKIEMEIERLKTLTGGLLSFSSNRSSQNRVVDVNELVGEVIRLVRFELQRKAVQLETELGDLAVINSDPNQLKQVIINLIMNAVQAMQGKGAITLRTTQISGDEIEISVQDTGPGIPEDVRKQIFKPFFTTKPEGEGTGLGLYLCQNIAQELGGSIRLQSAPGEGANFVVRLPIGE